MHGEGLSGGCGAEDEWEWWGVPLHLHLCLDGACVWRRSAAVGFGRLSLAPVDFVVWPAMRRIYIYYTISKGRGAEIIEFEDRDE